MLAEYMVRLFRIFFGGFGREMMVQYSFYFDQILNWNEDEVCFHEACVRIISVNSLYLLCSVAYFLQNI